MTVRVPKVGDWVSQVGWDNDWYEVVAVDDQHTTLRYGVGNTCPYTRNVTDRLWRYRYPEGWTVPTAKEVVTSPLETLRQEWKETIEGDGGKCPCCDRWGKINSKPLNETMAMSLEWLAGFDDWVNIQVSAPKEILRSAQLSTLRYWKLVERRAKEPGSNMKFSGYWRITQLGRDFVAGKVEVPRKVFMYNSEAVAFSTDTVTFKECSGVSFDYREVMSTSLIGEKFERIQPTQH